MKVTFAQMGNYSAAIRDLVEGVGCEFVAPDKTNAETVREGVKLAPETICFPCKVNLGNYMSAINKGADTIIMFDTQGQCRFRYYGMLQRKILKDYGHNVSFVIFSARHFISKLDELNKVSAFKKYRVIKLVWKKIKLVELIENLAKFYRPREIEGGQADNVMKLCLEDLDKANTFELVRKLKEKIGQRFEQIKIDPSRPVLRVGVIGEIFTVIDEYTNNQIESLLGKMGVEVHRDLTISLFIKQALNPWHHGAVKRKAKGYLNYIVGGHGMESVAEMLSYADKGYDGVVHLWPFGCMPEVTVRPILDKIRQEKDLPLLGLSLDEQSGQAGLQTRLEAFVDLMKAKQQLKNK